MSKIMYRAGFQHVQNISKINCHLILKNGKLTYIFFIILVIVGYSNAFNLTDGLDVLAIVSVMIVACSLFIFVYLIRNKFFRRETTFYLKLVVSIVCHLLLLLRARSNLCFTQSCSVLSRKAVCVNPQRD